jgi:integrase
MLWSEHLARDRRRSEHTIRAYRATAERLTAFLQAHWGARIDRADLSRVTASDLRAYLADRREHGLGNASAARELSAVRGFLAWANAQAEQPRMRGPRVKTGVPRPISPADAMALAGEVADDAAEPWIGARDWAVLLLLYGAGLRIGEALTLHGDILPLGETLRVTGKRAKTRVVPLLPQVRRRALASDDPSRGAGRTHAPWPWRPDDAACAPPQLCDPPAGPRRRPARATGATGACQPQLDAGLYAGRCRASDGRVPQRASARLTYVPSPWASRSSRASHSR